MLSFFTTTLSLVAALAPAVLGAPNIALRDVETFAGKVKPKGYIVTLKEGASKDVFNRTSNGFGGVLHDNDLNGIRANPDVESIAQDGIVSVTTTQMNAPWGLARISQRAALGSSDTSVLTYRYNYDPSGGAGVDVYVVDTSEYHVSTPRIPPLAVARPEEQPSVAMPTLTEIAMVPMSGTVGGTQYGVAKSVHLIAVKVLDDSGSGYISDILAGLEWVIDAVEASGKPSIVSLSLGGSACTAFDNGIIAAINAGIHVVVAAGNDNTNASGTSPARVAAAITAGASTIADARASFSNYGSVVDVFAPGQYITSSWIGGTTRTNNISGTSMATPHVSGLVAYLIGLNGNQSPVAINTLIKSLSVSSVLSNIPSGTVNLLANNGY
ncbi:related to Alkaline serine protease ver112 [Armillaria ostoyae]|uniref:Related to Alkaline serine protease ver112 n=1 Tax=Armillaria ostoyae TaxID=47428 RepID=A0A284S6F0_ARMOS|nr:related to Alkaline serine protease ver112 [Armillaria ostoyae]